MYLSNYAYYANSLNKHFTPESTKVYIAMCKISIHLHTLIQMIIKTNFTIDNKYLKSNKSKEQT